MSDIHIDTDAADRWLHCSNLLREASERIAEVRNTLMLKLFVVEGPPMEVIEAVEAAISGQACMFAPQSEWTGGDSAIASNFKWRKPHIANIPKDTVGKHCGAG